MQENPLYRKQACFFRETLASKLSYYEQNHLGLM
jgi:hypothetical protein